MKTIIKPDTDLKFIDLTEVIKFKELIYIFAWRDISVKYKQSMIGVGWVILQPLATMIIFSYFFGKISKIPSQGISYSVFVLTGLVFWGLFSNIVSHSSNSMVDNENIIKKVYFPKIIIPFSSIISSLPDFCINLVVLFIFAAINRAEISPYSLIYIFVGFIITSIFALGFGLILSATNVRFRDVRYALPFVLQVLMYTSPIIFPLNIISKSNQLIIALNPLSSAIDTARHSFMSNQALEPVYLLISATSATFIVILGLLYFQKTQKFFSDIV